MAPSDESDTAPPGFRLRDVHMEVGGSPHYVAAQAAAEGDTALLVGTVGPDPAGHWVRGALARWKPPATSLHVFDTGTCSARLVMEPSIGGDDVDITADPADGSIDVLAGRTAVSDGADYVHLSCFPGTDRLREALVNTGIPLIADFGFLPWRRDIEALAQAVRPRLAGVSVAVFNGLGAEEETVPVARDAVAAGVRVAVVTFGRGGAMVCDEHTTRRRPAPDVRVVNPVGAGDTLTTAFVHAWHHGASPGQALEYGQAAAARHVSRRPAEAGAGTRTRSVG
ncbi:carbohydrate kinase family protein [Streptomyces cellostaticus]|uniref:carbohydrate kinase family protein n=1 Tax=Streptomyces cellostaticus TaxID=67285 RepID=UPI0020271B01|nr:carbohydrate kinase family protein [Streptomyces cellostaticus]